MRAGVERQSDRTVARRLHDDSRVDALRKQERRCRVAEVKQNHTCDMCEARDLRDVHWLEHDDHPVVLRWDATVPVVS